MLDEYFRSENNHLTFLTQSNERTKLIVKQSQVKSKLQSRSYQISNLRDVEMFITTMNTL